MKLLFFLQVQVRDRTSKPPLMAVQLLLLLLLFCSPSQIVDAARLLCWPCRRTELTIIGLSIIFVFVVVVHALVLGSNPTRCHWPVEPSRPSRSRPAPPRKLTRALEWSKNECNRANSFRMYYYWLGIELRVPGRCSLQFFSFCSSDKLAGLCNVWSASTLSALNANWSNSCCCCCCYWTQIGWANKEEGERENSF